MEGKKEKGKGKRGERGCRADVRRGLLWVQTCLDAVCAALDSVAVLFVNPCRGILMRRCEPPVSA